MAGESFRIVAGPAAGSEIQLGDELQIGRAAPVEGQLGGDPELSRTHARITRDPQGHVLIEDLGSTNGTAVNGRRIATPTVLAPGDNVQIGKTTLELRVSPRGQAGGARAPLIPPDLGGGARDTPPPFGTPGPTELRGAPGTATGPPAGGGRRRRGLLVALGVLLLVAAIAAAVLLLADGGDDPATGPSGTGTRGETQARSRREREAIATLEALIDAVHSNDEDVFCGLLSPGQAQRLVGGPGGDAAIARCADVARRVDLAENVPSDVSVVAVRASGDRASVRLTTGERFTLIRRRGRYVVSSGLG